MIEVRDLSTDPVTITTLWEGARLRVGQGVRVTSVEEPDLPWTAILVRLTANDSIVFRGNGAGEVRAMLEEAPNG